MRREVSVPACIAQVVDVSWLLSVRLNLPDHQILKLLPTQRYGCLSACNVATKAVHDDVTNLTNRVMSRSRELHNHMHAA